MANYLVTGNQGTGKSHVGYELERLGYSVIHADDQLVADGSSSQSWLWDARKFAKLVCSHAGDLFVCGGAHNEESFYRFFTEIFVLHVGDDLLKLRLAGRRWPPLRANKARESGDAQIHVVDGEPDVQAVTHEIERLSQALKKENIMHNIRPVDRTQRVMSDGSAEKSNHREIDPVTGQQKGYVVLTEGERAGGFVNPVRLEYTHLTCGSDTSMGLAIAETFARDPGFYGGGFCCACREHFPVKQFVWKGTEEVVGS